jgi:hypothetical protein
VEDYVRIKLGPKKIEDGAIDFEFYKKVPSITKDYRRKEFILEALASRNKEQLRDISRFYYETNGIYQKIVNYYASMYRFDWYVTTDNVAESANTDKVLKNYLEALSFFDNSRIKEISQ